MGVWGNSEMSMTAVKKTKNTSVFDREAQYAAKRLAVIRAAGAAFRRRGYHNASMVDIAKTLGLSKAALYYYVRSKEEILYECHMSVYDAMDRLIRENRSPDLSGLTELENLYAEFAHMLTRDGLALLADVDSLNGDFQATVLARRAKIERAVTRTVKRGMGDGSIRVSDPRVTVFFFMGALNWLNVWYEPEGRISADQITEAFVRQMSAGIRA